MISNKSKKMVYISKSERVKKESNIYSPIKIENLSLDQLDKEKCYCNACFNEGYLSPLLEKDNYYEKICQHKRIWRLQFINNSWEKIIGLNKNSKVRNFHHKCNNPKCGYEEENKIPDNRWVCPKCNSKNKILHKCPNCNFEEENYSLKWICPNCNFKNFKEGIFYHICENPKCGYEEENNCPIATWICPKCNWHKDILYHHICPECNFKEDSNSTNWVCSNCGYNTHKYKHKCNNQNCNYEEENSTPDNRWICPKCNTKSENYQTFHHICENPDCQYEENNCESLLTWTCPKCGWFKERIFHYLCPDCGYEENCKSTKWICKECGYKNFKESIVNHICPNCNCKETNNSSIWTCPKCNWSNISIHHICENPNCQYEENTNNWNWVCPKCGLNIAKYEHICPNCNNKIINKGPNFSCNICGYVSYSSKSNIKYLYCKKCKNFVPHRNNICLICSGEYVWCEVCEIYGSKEIHSKICHNIDERSETRIWINENPDIFSNMKNTIKNFNIIEKYGNNPGIYEWLINNSSVYIGESIEILNRSFCHIKNICKYPETWYNIFNNLTNNIIEIKILEKINKDNYSYLTDHDFKYNILKKKELEWIAKKLPDSQKCNGTDHIKTLNERKLKINL